MNTPYYADGPVTLYAGDCIDIMREMPDASVDAVVTDPPYGLEFMGKDWDSFKPAGAHAEARTRRADEMLDESKRRFIAPGVNTYAAGRPFQTWCTKWATEALRVLKPGGHLLAFGGTRTFHRLTAGIEDAGFEIRDSIAWMYGSGFPKSRNLDGEWAGWGTALKPAFEPITVARKPLTSTVAANVVQWGTGALNIDGTRIAHDGKSAAWVEKWSGNEGHPSGDFGTMGRQFGGSAQGRWPANVILDESQAAALDEQSGTSQSRIGKPRGAAAGNGWGMTATGAEYDDIGGASRFFYTAKAAQDERPSVDGIAHPTVKPLDLMRWLVKLVTPMGGTVLEPFAGSGTTVEAAVLEGFNCIAIEREPDYLPLIEKRIRKPHHVGFDFGDWDGESA